MLPLHSFAVLVGVLQPRHGRNRGGLGCSPFARHYLGNHCCFLFLPLLRCFSSRGSPLHRVQMTDLQPAGLPHSEISGSKVVCTSPELIAAYHVFLRLPEPRHPPMCPFLLSPPCRLRTAPLPARHIPSAFYACFFLVFFFSLELYLLLLFFEKSILFSCSNMSMNPCVNLCVLSHCTFTTWWRITDSNR